VKSKMAEPTAPPEGGERSEKKPKKSNEIPKGMRGCLTASRALGGKFRQSGGAVQIARPKTDSKHTQSEAHK